MFYKTLIRPALFLLNPEEAHNFIFSFLIKNDYLYPLFKLVYNPKRNWETININGLKFRNRLGLAAGLDKDGVAIRFFDVIGFSHIEVGTVTPLPQPGNPKPRLFRLVGDKALINRMGFNNCGAVSLKKNIVEAKKYINKDFIIGVNIGKNKITPLEKAVDDYKKCMEILYEAADYFTVNISSPNTEGLRELQNKKYLDDLLNEINETNKLLAQKYSIPTKNIFLKIAPDLTDEEIEEIYYFTFKHELTGIAATNTTLSRNNLTIDINERGGLSGIPVKDISDNVLAKLNKLNEANTFGKLHFIGSGGVFNKNDYKDKLRNGADLVQVYTGYIYEGNAIIKNILR